MEETPHTKLERYRAELDKTSAPAWRKVLETLAIVGVADSTQLERTMGLTHMQWERLLERLHELSPNILKKCSLPDTFWFKHE